MQDIIRFIMKFIANRADLRKANFNQNYFGSFKSVELARIKKQLF